ncbi:hypothetical protein FRC11_006684 [Ceratobasidium sp. 423]|nr:hypothetical protein FRC11_006684 [Ceratobasidium sp. 423]
MAPTRTADTPNRRDADEDETRRCTLARSGRQMTRLVDMFWSVDDVLLFSKKWHRMSVNDRLTFKESADESKLRILALSLKLIELEPKVIESLCQGGRHSDALWKYTRIKLGIGETNGRSEDMCKAREELPQWEKFDPPLGLNATRGLAHRRCAYYLSSPEMDWNNETVVMRFMSYGLPAMDPSDWPRFFWPGGVCNLERPSEGLLRGELLIKAAISILLSPASARLPTDYQTATPAHTPARGQRRGLIGLAKTYKLTEITPAFIAYVAIVVRHSLTSDGEFREICGGFDYVDFYNQVREFLEKPQYAQWSAALIQYWNAEIFKGYQLGLTTPPERRKNGTLSKLTAELQGTDIQLGGASQQSTPDK